MSAQEENRIWKELLSEAYERFHIQLRESHDSRWRLSDYAFTQQVQHGKWRDFAGEMVASNLLEAINLQNRWSQRLSNWSAWIAVLAQYENADEWDVRSHFVEPIAELCMLQPSSTRDRLGTLATAAIHQASLVVHSGYLDRLDQDWDGRIANRHLSRRETEKQLLRIGKEWKSFEIFFNNLHRLDTEKYRQTTRNFRNRASHGIAPRFKLGVVSLVERAFVARTNLVKQPDGSYRQVEHATEKVVRYSVGGTNPLNLDEMLEANGEQFLIAREAIGSYQELLSELLVAMA